MRTAQRQKKTARLGCRDAVFESVSLELPDQVELAAGGLMGTGGEGLGAHHSGGALHAGSQLILEVYHMTAYIGAGVVRIAVTTNTVGTVVVGNPVIVQ